MNPENPTEQTLEKSARYVAGYLKFDYKKDLSEVFKPFFDQFSRIAQSLDLIAKHLEKQVQGGGYGA